MQASLRHGVAALWSLLEACRVGTPDERAVAAAAAAAGLRAARSADGALTLTVDESGLLVDGEPVIAGVDTFAATHGLWSYLRRTGVVAVGFAAALTADELLRWASAVVERGAPTGWPAGIEVSARGEAQRVDGPVRPVQRALPVAPPPDSRLRSVFLQHRLIAGLPRLAGVDPTTAKLVVQGVVDRLLQVERGLEPLMLLQQDEGLLQRSTAVAVLAVLFARRAGWPADRLADLGAAALLHDLGMTLAPEAPDPAAFRWLLARGDDDFWLRCALVARHWRDARGLDELRGRGLPVAVALVRLAALAGAAGGAGQPAREWRDAVARGSVPAELAAVAAGAFGG